jgi:hypothetical protein
MKFFPRVLLLAVPGTFLAVGAGAAVARLGGPDPFGRDLPGAWQLYVQESQRREALSNHERALAESLEVKRQAVAELIAGRLTLAQAVARFRAAQAAKAGEGGGASGTYPGLSDEVLTQNVLSWVAAQLCDQPAKAAAVEARLRAEQEQMRARSGRPPL